MKDIGMNKPAAQNQLAVTAAQPSQASETKAQLVELLRKLVAFPTVTTDEQSLHEALDFIASFVVLRGMHVERFESGGFESLIATVKPGNKTPKVMLAAHLDLVPAPDEAFELRKADGKLYGRGVLDMKFAIASYLQFIDEVQNRLEDYDFGLMITCDEETGGLNGTGPLVAEGYLPGVCILPDGGDNWQVQVHAKGFSRLKLASYGVSAHGSRPWLGKSAFAPLLKALHEVESLFPENNADSNTYNLGKMAGGNVGNQVADYAEAFLDLRFMNDREKQRITEATRAICDQYGIELTVQLDGAASAFSLENPYIAPFVALITEITGTVVTGAHTLGNSDARFFSEWDVPCISVYPTGGGHHGPEEWLDETAFHQFKEILNRYMDKVACVS